jgi:hypothetical protein
MKSVKKNAAAVALGRMASGVKKTMSTEAVAQRKGAVNARWKKWRDEKKKASKAA